MPTTTPMTDHRRVLAIAIPMILSGMTIPLAGMVDTAVMGHLDDARYLAAVAQRYFAIRIYGAPFLLGIYVLTGWFIGVQQPRRVLALLLLSNGLNVLLDLLFVPLLGMRADGVALATVLAEVTAFSFGCWLLLRQRGMGARLWRIGRLFAPGEARQLLQLNRDLFLRTIALMIVFT